MAPVPGCQSAATGRDRRRTALLDRMEASPRTDSPGSAARTLNPRRARRLGRRAWWVLTLLLLAWGLRLALLPEHPIWSYPLLVRVGMLAPLLALLPPVARAISMGIGRLRRMPRGARRWVALAVAVLSMGYLYAS